MKVVLLALVVGTVTGVSLKCGEDIIVSRGQKKVLKFWSSEDEFLNVDIIPKRGEVKVGGKGDGEARVKVKGRGTTTTVKPSPSTTSRSSSNTLKTGGQRKEPAPVKQSQGDLYYSVGARLTSQPPTTTQSSQTEVDAANHTHPNRSSEGSHKQRPGEGLGVNTVFLEDSIVYDYKTEDDYVDDGDDADNTLSLQQGTLTDDANATEIHHEQEGDLDEHQSPVNQEGDTTHHLDKVGHRDQQIISTQVLPPLTASDKFSAIRNSETQTERVGEVDGITTESQENQDQETTVNPPTETEVPGSLKDAHFEDINNTTDREFLEATTHVPELLRSEEITTTIPEAAESNTDTAADKNAPILPLSDEDLVTDELNIFVPTEAIDPSTERIYGDAIDFSLKDDGEGGQTESEASTKKPSETGTISGDREQTTGDGVTEWTSSGSRQPTITPRTPGEEGMNLQVDSMESSTDGPIRDQGERTESPFTSQDRLKQPPTVHGDTKHTGTTEADQEHLLGVLIDGAPTIVTPGRIRNEILIPEELLHKTPPDVTTEFLNELAVAGFLQEDVTSEEDFRTTTMIPTTEEISSSEEVESKVKVSKIEESDASMSEATTLKYQTDLQSINEIVPESGDDAENALERSDIIHGSEEKSGTSDSKESSEENISKTNASVSETSNNTERSELLATTEPSNQFNSIEKSEMHDNTESPETPDITERSDVLDTTEQSIRVEATENSEVYDTTDISELVEVTEKSENFNVTERSDVLQSTERSAAADTTERSEVPKTSESSETLLGITEASEVLDVTIRSDILNATERSETSDITETPEIFDATEKMDVLDATSETSGNTERFEIPDISYTTEGKETFDTKERSDLSDTSERTDFLDKELTTEYSVSADQENVTEVSSAEIVDYHNRITEEVEETTERYIPNDLISGANLEMSAGDITTVSEGLIAHENDEVHQQNGFSADGAYDYYYGDYIYRPGDEAEGETNPYLSSFDYDDTVEYDTTTQAPIGSVKEDDRPTQSTLSPMVLPADVVNEEAERIIAVAHIDTVSTESPYNDDMTITTQQTTMAGGFKINELEEADIAMMSATDDFKDMTTVSTTELVNENDALVNGSVSLKDTDNEEDVVRNTTTLETSGGNDGSLTDSIFNEIIDSLTNALENAPEEIHVPVGDFTISIQDLFDIANNRSSSEETNANLTSEELPVEHRDKITLIRSDSVEDEAQAEVTTEAESPFGLEDEEPQTTLRTDSLSMAGFMDHSILEMTTIEAPLEETTQEVIYDYPDVADEDGFKGYDYYESLVDSLLAQDRPYSQNKSEQAVSPTTDNADDVAVNSVTSSGQKYVYPTLEFSMDDVKLTAEPHTTVSVSSMEVTSLQTRSSEGDGLEVTTIPYDVADTSFDDGSENSSSESTETTTVFSIPYLILQNQAMLDEILTNQKLGGGSSVIIKEQGSKVAVSSPAHDETSREQGVTDDSRDDTFTTTQSSSDNDISRISIENVTNSSYEVVTNETQTTNEPDAVTRGPDTVTDKPDVQVKKPGSLTDNLDVLIDKLEELASQVSNNQTSKPETTTKTQERDNNIISLDMKGESTDSLPHDDKTMTDKPDELSEKSDVTNEPKTTTDQQEITTAKPDATATTASTLKVSASKGTELPSPVSAEPAVREEPTEYFWNYASQKTKPSGHQEDRGSAGVGGSEDVKSVSSSTESSNDSETLREGETSEVIKNDDEATLKTTEQSLSSTTSEPELATILLPSSFIDRLGEVSKDKVREEEGSTAEARPPNHFDIPGIFSRKDDEGFTEYGGDSPFFIKLPGSPNAVPVYIQYEPVEVKYVPLKHENEADDDNINYRDPVTYENDGSVYEYRENPENPEVTDHESQVSKEENKPAETYEISSNFDATMAESSSSDSLGGSEQNEAQQTQENSLLNGIYRILDNVAGSVGNQYPQNAENKQEGPNFKPNRPVVKTPDPFFLMEAPQLGGSSDGSSSHASHDTTHQTHGIQGHNTGFSVDVSSQFGFESSKPETHGVRTGTVEDVPIGTKQDVLYPGDYYKHDAYTGVNLSDLTNPVFNLRTKATTPSAEDLMTPQYTPFPITTNPPRTTTTFAPLSALPLSTSFHARQEDKRLGNAPDYAVDTVNTTTERTMSEKPLPSVEFSPIPSIDFADSYDSPFLPETLYDSDRPFPIPIEEYTRDQTYNADPEPYNNGFSAAPFKTSDAQGSSIPLNKAPDGVVTPASLDQVVVEDDDDGNIVLENHPPPSKPFTAHDQVWSFPKSREEPGQHGFHDSTGRVYSAFYSPLDVPGIDPALFSYRKVPSAKPVESDFRQHPTGQEPPRPIEDSAVRSVFGSEDFPSQASKSEHDVLLGPQFFDYLNTLPYALLKKFLDPNSPPETERLKRSAPREGEQIFCEWNIRTEPGLYLLMTFHNLSAAYTVDCHGAYIEVERENNGYDARWCGNRVSLAGSRPHVIFAKTEVRITVYDDGSANKALPTGFEADIEVIDLFDPNEYTAFMRSNAYPHIRRLLLG